ncbi:MULTISPECIES: CBS domain-containing protein [Streptomyces]|uniref:CBS domain-containing protein n=1 Tax=Streptomyces caniscabiei TaxID=2746961 RepID=A0ABU4N493_9ACTN|nr:MULTISPECIES: CBS domain-containing protein [Streptomyces]MBE4733513.1 CBS domain-containing protein [Streptomyces caniscabiei]MBE4754690.1 CBS domain-containing protein [Streptomyces caniscabiei]MBE4768489.1 CBS domain-containing protein [Streptomyces caniscabiei]MBE4782008.1 CBS domain-containing protein [Streptomyces caniscabiei]MBE4793297.1 CBS domain-containing protein [Streptomyces caniscabiei]
MKHDKVGSVMTTDVVRAEYDTPFKEVARLLADHGISGLPVIDDDEKVIGVVSDTDLMARQAEAPDPYESRGRHLFGALTRGARRQAAKAEARSAGRLMTEPPITVHADDTVVEAARTMAQHRVERLPVVDEEERLVGIVTRRDLLQVFLRPDEEIRSTVTREVVVRTLWLAPHSVDVTVDQGVVTLSGQLERKSETEIAVSMTRQVDGVVGVVDKLTWRLDDAHIEPAEQALHGVTDHWLRRL